MLLAWPGVAPNCNDFFFHHFGMVTEPTTAGQLRKKMGEKDCVLFFGEVQFSKHVRFRLNFACLIWLAF